MRGQKTGQLYPHKMQEMVANHCLHDSLLKVIKSSKYLFFSAGSELTGGKKKIYFIYFCLKYQMTQKLRWELTEVTDGSNSWFCWVNFEHGDLMTNPTLPQTTDKKNPTQQIYTFSLFTLPHLYLVRFPQTIQLTIYEGGVQMLPWNLLLEAYI